MIRIPLPDSYEPVFIEFSEDAHDTRVKVMIGDVDITDLLICSRDVLNEAKKEAQLYHSGIIHQRDYDFDYECDRDMRDSNGA